MGAVMGAVMGASPCILGITHSSRRVRSAMLFRFE
jgi:hypothetical protein